MATQKISENVSELTDNAKHYIRLKIGQFKLTLVEKSSILISILLVAAVIFLVLLFVSLFLSLAFIYYYRDHWGAEWAGALIVTGFYLVIGLIVFVFRKNLFINPVVAMISQLILEEDDDEENR